MSAPAIRLPRARFVVRTRAARRSGSAAGDTAPLRWIGKGVQGGDEGKVLTEHEASFEAPAFQRHVLVTVIRAMSAGRNRKSLQPTEKS